MVAGVRGAGRGGSELRLRVKTMTTASDAHAVLNGIDVPPGGHLCDRIWSVRDRIMLLPEGDDTADLVGEINERCDRAGVPEGKPGERVEWLAAERERLRDELSSVRNKYEVAEFEMEKWRIKCDLATQRRDELASEVSSLKADLAAERAQLAAPAGEFVCAASLDEVRAAVETLVSRVDGSTESADRLAVLVLGRAFGVLVEELA